jgi:dTDP-4-amino-4,6-dideoxygalactose transaminase
MSPASRAEGRHAGAAPLVSPCASINVDPVRRSTKARVDDLAIFGGPPAFEDKLHVGRPNIGNRNRLAARLNDLLDRRQLSNEGPYVLEFEATLAARLGVRNCVAVANATTGLQIVVRAAGLSGQVIVPSFTFIASPHALLWHGVTPIFCDVDPQTHNLSPGRVEALITPQVKGIVGVHVWGRACAVDELTEIARRRGLTLLFDAAHGLLCSHRGRMIGGFGQAEVLSFHATKVVNSFEGGAIVTDDDALAQRARLMRNFGFTGYDEVGSLGTNGKMNEASAAMGLTSLESADEFVAVNRRNYLAYRYRLGGIPGLELVSYPEAEQNNYHYVVMEVDHERLGLSRDQLQQVLWAENIVARRYFYPGCHRMEPYCSKAMYRDLRLPATDALASRVLCLPTGTAVGVDAIEVVCDVIDSAVRHGAEVACRLRDGSTGDAA